ncbi:hypothetical protein SEA_DAUBENSKI_198 [Streptomyces phage Daubenski]|uniref:Uncharacterized protein n=1 Tax=Streptomyces phage Daubenski TaxID=2653725 RepID=A0A5Q2WGE5_9CAUD|nr:hypothetical protein KNU80_gp104 [Streptomyces phage Daubenski]QGH76468.1 hypothetical protein SEA_DAUBENSKI_198 [Streptomyces phage Daubenski]
MDTDVKIGIIIATVVLGIFVIVAGSINLNTYMMQKTAQQCTQSGRVWVNDDCLDKVTDVRYIDD